MSRHRRHESYCADSELLTRTSWVDARVAYKQIRKGKAFGNSCALWLRMHLQRHLLHLGSFIQRHCGKVLFVGLLLLSLCCVGLKTVTIETDVERLWVEEDGRLERELAYSRDTLGEGSGLTNEILIQTAKDEAHHYLLSVSSLLTHFTAVQAATRVSVNMYDMTWEFKDICLKASFPSFEDRLLDNMIENILPCVIVTPLDCFWEGSKLLRAHRAYAPGYDIIQWTSLHPRKLVERMMARNAHFPSSTVMEIMDRAGIDSGYQEKPCLDPTDPECPATAPNKLSKQPPDIGHELTGGCSGFATKYMHWEEDLVVGGTSKNKTGSITKAEALQSIVQIMGERELYEYYRDNYKVHNVDWDQDKAKEILAAWQRKFSLEVARAVNDSLPDNVWTFSSSSLLDLLKDFSQMSIVRVAIGYLLMLVYACISLLRWTDAVQSQSGVGIAGVLLVALSVAAGLGICSVIGITFNASTTQIIPFLALGLGVDDMFLLAHTFAENANKEEIPTMDQTGVCLKRTGVSILLTSISNAVAFFMAAIIPIPALRAFALQVAILVVFNLVTVLVVFPAVVSFDLMRREAKRVDVFCCFIGSSANRVVTATPGTLTTGSTRGASPPPPYSRNNAVAPAAYTNPVLHQAVTHTPADGARPVTVLMPPEYTARSPSLPSLNSVSTTSSHQNLAGTDRPSIRDRCRQTQSECCQWSLSWFARTIYGPALQKKSAKVFVLIAFTALLVFGIFGTVRVQDGLDLTDVVPKNTKEYQFLSAQGKYFGFYHMYAVTKKDFDYPNNQALLHEYHQQFQKIDSIIKREDGTLPEFWLQQFQRWIKDLQRAFDKDMAQGLIDKDGWLHHANASDDAILAYKLLIQTGDLDSPIDKDRVHTGRLMDDDGIIDPSGFYTYLTAWTSNDAMAYMASEANFHPLPPEWYFEAQSYGEDLKIPRAHPLIYTQLPFFLNNMGNTHQVTETIVQIRGICETYEAKGLPNYPSGIPFTYYEQYIHLRFYLMLSLIFVLAGIFLVITVILVNPWAAIVIVAVLAMIVVELFGFMGLVGIKLSAVPAVVLIVSVGIGVEFTVHICLGYMTAIGSKGQRMQMALEHMLAPVVHGAISTLLGVIMLAGAEFDFIVRYFFLVLTALVVLGMLNGLVLLPVLLTIIGPNAEVIPLDDADHLAPPTPEPSPPLPRPVRTISRRVPPRIMQSTASLSTITEEPTQYSSHEIIVEPEVTVETTTVPGGVTVVSSNNNRNSSSSDSSSSSTQLSHTVTKVTATAMVKVNVHTPIPGHVQTDPEYKHKRRKSRDVEDDSSNSEADSRC